MSRPPRRAFSLDSEGLGFGAPGFWPSRCPELQEDIHLVGAAVSYSMTDRVNIAGSNGKVVRGRNTAASSVFSISLAYALNQKE